MRQKELALTIKVVDVVALLAALIFTVYPMPTYLEGISNPDTNLGSALRHAILPFIVVTVVPLVIIATNTWLIASAISRNESFITVNALRLRRIGFAAFAEAALYALATALTPLGGKLDAGGLAVALVVVLACLALAVIAFTASHLAMKAADIQSENELTV